jgi:hypothetical protein
MESKQDLRDFVPVYLFVHSPSQALIESGLHGVTRIRRRMAESPLADPVQD